MAEEEIDNIYKTNLKEIWNFDLKQEQLSLITAICNGKDSLGVLPTGYGKSMVYTLAPLLMDQVSNLTYYSHYDGHLLYK